MVIHSVQDADDGITAGAQGCIQTVATRWNTDFVGIGRAYRADHISLDDAFFEPVDLTITPVFMADMTHHVINAQIQHGRGREYALITDVMNAHDSTGAAE